MTSRLPRAIQNQLDEADWTTRKDQSNKVRLKRTQQKKTRPDYIGGDPEALQIAAAAIGPRGRGNKRAHDLYMDLAVCLLALHRSGVTLPNGYINKAACAVVLPVLHKHKRATHVTVCDENGKAQLVNNHGAIFRAIRAAILELNPPVKINIQ